jgi:hypothetical protein
MFLRRRPDFFHHAGEKFNSKAAASLAASRTIKSPDPCVFAPGGDLFPRPYQARIDATAGAATACTARHRSQLLDLFTTTPHSPVNNSRQRSPVVALNLGL